MHPDLSELVLEVLRPEALVHIENVTLEDQTLDPVATARVTRD
jgi:hypothetical protein